MNKENIIYKRAIKSSNSKKILSAIDVIENENYIFNLIEKYFKKNTLLELINENNSKITEDLLIKFFKIKKYNTTISAEDLMYLKEIGMKKLVIFMICSKSKEKQEKLILEAGIYAKELLKYLSSDIDFLYKLYVKTGDDSILDIVLLNNISVSIYDEFKCEINDIYQKKFIDRIIECNKISDILIKDNHFSEKEIIYMWKKLEYDLTSQDIYIIFESGYYEKEDIVFLIDRICDLKEAEFLWYFLVVFEDEDLTVKQKIKLEKALKETNDLEYNLYYGIYKNKEKFIDAFGGTALLYSYIKMNEDSFEFKEAFDSLCDYLEGKLRKDMCEKQEYLNNILFKYENQSYYVKIAKKRKNNLKK